MKHKAILLIDFDDTVVDSKYPRIIGLKPKVKEIINKLYLEGFYIIINTCRTGDQELKVIQYLRDVGILFHRINTNHPGLISYFKEDSRKLSGDIHIDDKNIECLHRSTTYCDLNMKSSYKASYWENQYKMIHEIINSKNFKSILNLVQ